MDGLGDLDPIGRSSRGPCLIVSGQISLWTTRQTAIVHTYERRAEGVGSWLHFEFCCHRASLFGERYLTTAIGQILQAEYGTNTRAEVDHPILAQLQKVRGRRPQIEFAIMENYPAISVAVESKWCGDSGLPLEDELCYLVRLELLAKTGAEAYFVLAGKAPHLREFWAHPHLIQAEKPLLPHPDSRQRTSIRFDSPPTSRVELLRKTIRKASKELKFPATVKISSPFVFPAKPATHGFQAFV